MSMIQEETEYGLSCRLGCKVRIFGNLYLNGLLKKYHTGDEKYQTPVKRLSEHKKELISCGLPIKFSSEDEKTFGEIYLSNRGEIIVAYKSVEGKIYEEQQKIYLIDANDEILKLCKKL